MISSTYFYLTVPSEFGPRNLNWVVSSIILGAMFAGSFTLLAMMYVMLALRSAEAP